jgi:hypothetical protein
VDDKDGAEDGSDDGEAEGRADGIEEGMIDGIEEGLDDGNAEGLDEGDDEGDDEGAGVATTGLLDGAGEARVCVGVGAMVNLITILDGHPFLVIIIIFFFFFLQERLPPPPFPLSSLEDLRSPRTIGVWRSVGSSENGDDSDEDDDNDNDNDVFEAETTTTAVPRGGARRARRKHAEKRTKKATMGMVIFKGQEACQRTLARVREVKQKRENIASKSSRVRSIPASSVVSFTSSRE